MNTLQGKHILLGITGSIAAYKAVDLASKLAQAGAEVDVLLTDAATRFVSALTFQSVTARSAYTDANLWGAEAHILHVRLSKPADALVIAPASANTIAKLAHGLADNLLTITALAATCPLVIAPAMDGGMYASPANQENLAMLEKRGALIIGPEEGHLASGLTAKGRMTEPAEIFNRIRYLLSRGGPMAGRKMVVTAGGTQEPMDPVRMLTNRSSGKQGYAIAQAALDLGADVTLISATITLPVPSGATVISVRTAAGMLAAVQDACSKADALIMAAAVSDFRPKTPAASKIKKDAAPDSIELEKTPDILTEISACRLQTGFPRVLVGFAAETENLKTSALAKLKSKKLDLIVANDVTAPDAGFEADTNRVTILDASGTVTDVPLGDKYAISETILHRVIDILADKV
jgi:phosphopantothenoylcysteine decarboxylase / phosphopantothenate---cysteine ligase